VGVALWFGVDVRFTANFVNCELCPQSNTTGGF
jgi:hypothetical protein